MMVVSIAVDSNCYLDSQLICKTNEYLSYCRVNDFNAFVKIEEYSLKVRIFEHDFEMTK